MHAQRSKVIVSVRLSVCHHKNFQIWRSIVIRVTHINTTDPSKLSKTWFHYASNQLARPMSIANTSHTYWLHLMCFLLMRIVQYYYSSACNAAYNLFDQTGLIYSPQRSQAHMCVLQIWIVARLNLAIRQIKICQIFWLYVVARAYRLLKEKRACN